MTGLSSRDGMSNMWALWCPTCGWMRVGSACGHRRLLFTAAPDLESHALAMAMELAQELQGCVEDYDVDRGGRVSDWLRLSVTSVLYADLRRRGL